MTVGAQPPAPPRGVYRHLPAAVATGAGAFVLASLIASAMGVNVGAKLAPFFSRLEPRIDVVAVVAIPLFAAAAVGAVALVRRDTSSRAFAGWAVLLALISRLALAAAGRGPSGWDTIFLARGHNEYLPALPAVRNLGLETFLDRFAQIAPSLPIHPSGHPPGTLVLLYLTGVDTPAGMAALVIVVGALCVPLSYVLARRLGYSGRAARVAALLVMFSPAVLIYGATSADALYGTLGLLAAITLTSDRVRTVIIGAVVAVIGSFFTYSLLAVPALAAVYVALRDGLKRAALVAAICGITLLAGYALLYAVTGYDPLGALHSANQAYRVGIASIRPYAYWLIGSPVAFFVACGLPTAWYWLRSLAATDRMALSLAVIVAVAAVLGFTKAETERIWLFFVPFAAIAAAKVLPDRMVPLSAGLLCAQALAVELLIDTAW